MAVLNVSRGERMHTCYEVHIWPKGIITISIIKAKTGCILLLIRDDDGAKYTYPTKPDSITYKI